MPDYIPQGDVDFDEWIDAVCAYIGANFQRLGLSEEEAQGIIGPRERWSASYVAHMQAQAAAAGSRARKDNDRAAMEAAIRPLIQRIQLWPQTTDADREMMNVTVRRHRASRLSVGPEDGVPIALIDKNQRQMHTIRIRVERLKSIKLARPAGALACEIRMKISDRPPKVQDMDTIGVATGRKYIVRFSGEDIGKTAYYAMRWIGRDGQPGAWGPTAAATVTA